MPSRRILIVGGSTRAAADSVRRAGWEPVCADLFADLDLRMTAEVIPIRKYPDSLPEDVAHIRADGWFYCGALENHPEILERMLTADAAYGPLLGTSPDSLKLVRNPDWLAETLRRTGMNALEIASQSSAPEPNGSWLQKPLAKSPQRNERFRTRERAPVMPLSRTTLERQLQAANADLATFAKSLQEKGLTEVQCKKNALWRSLNANIRTVRRRLAAVAETLDLELGAPIGREVLA